MDTIKVWEKRVINIQVLQVRILQKSGMDYLNQSIEIDAIAFAYNQIKELFNVEVKIQDAIRIQVREYIGTIKLMSDFIRSN